MPPRNQSVTDNAGAAAGVAFFVIPDPVDRRSQQPMPSAAGCLAGAAETRIPEQNQEGDDWSRAFDHG